MSDVQHAELIAWLAEQGYSQTKIEKVMAKVAEYDAQTVRESIFDSINSGTIDIAEFVREALGEE
jgi:hypothetical protein